MLHSHRIGNIEFKWGKESVIIREFQPDGTARAIMLKRADLLEAVDKIQGKQKEAA